MTTAGSDDATRVALVTGASGVIGSAITQELLAEGFTVVATFNTRPAGPQLSPETDASERTRLRIEHCDVTQAESVDALRRTLADDGLMPEVLVHCAGITDAAPMLAMSADRFERVVDTNLVGAYRVCRSFMKSMLAQRYGRIVLVGSVAGHWGSRGQTNYSAAKAGLVGLCRALTREVADRGICVNVVAPGPIESEMMSEGDQVDLDALALMIPAKRLGHPDEVAYVVSTLCRRRSSYITGALIPVDGGMGMGT